MWTSTLKILSCILLSHLSFLQQRERNKSKTLPESWHSVLTAKIIFLAIINIIMEGYFQCTFIYKWIYWYLSIGEKLYRISPISSNDVNKFSSGKLSVLHETWRGERITSFRETKNYPSHKFMRTKKKHAARCPRTQGIMPM